MKQLRTFIILALVLMFTGCGDDGTDLTIQSDRCNDGDQATLSLTINGVGTFTFTDGSSAISHASDTEGSGIDAISMYMRWVDPVSGDSIIFDITVENETLAVATYNNNPLSFNGSVNFYTFTAGVQTAWYTFNDWTTTIDEFEVFETTSGGGFTNTKLAFVMASTSGVLRKVGDVTTHTFNSSYTICPRY